ncbi:MAG TPA: PIN domain-containing protein [Thermoguttaceae bacterium]|nr:PIN domain-containing protein [Thermoguttaceae bacterium]
MGLIVLRCIFVMVAAGLGVFFIKSGALPEATTWMTWGVFGGMLLLSLGVIALDVAIRRKHLDTISAVYFGLIVGLFMAYVAGLALTPLFEVVARGDIDAETKLHASVQLVLAAVFCYICISLLMQTRHDFRFIIPYVEFSKEVKGSRPCVLDTSVVIDGRIADVVDTQIFDAQLVMPKFVISELQGIADSSDRLRRSRGRRGLDILNRLQNNPDVDLKIFDRELPEFAGQPVDLKLVMLAKHIEGKLITNDYNLNKVARLQGVRVINFNDLANALKPVFLPGEHVEVRIVKPGEEAGQGVGYLDDGTMVVVDGGRDYVNQNVSIAVTSVLQTSAGRMVFGRYDSTRQEAAQE